MHLTPFLYVNTYMTRIRVSVSHDSGKVDLPTALFSCCLNVVVILSPPLKKYFQWRYIMLTMYLPVLFYSDNISPSKVSNLQHLYPLFAPVILFSLAHTCV